MAHRQITERHPKRPRDPAQLAKLIVDIATGEVEEPQAEPTDALVEAADVKPGKRGRYRKRGGSEEA